MNTKHWPMQERPREKLQRLGARHLSDAELLAILLRVGTPGCHVLEQAQGLIAHFGSLKQVFLADEQKLLAYKGIGLAAYCQFAVVLEIAKRVVLEQQRLCQIKTAEDVLPLLQAHLCAESVEVLLAVWLDSDNRVVAVDEISRGSLSHHTVYVRELVKRGLQQQAGAVILAHNHPSGNVQPSQSDIEHTQCLQAALGLLDIVLLDHLIVANQAYCSVLHA